MIFFFFFLYQFLKNKKVSGLTCTPVAAGSTLLIGGTTVCSGSRTVSQANINAGGSIVNTATVAFVELTRLSNTVTVPIVQSPGFTVSKSGPTGAVSVVGTQLQYQMTVSNTGNVDLPGFVFDDALLGSAFTCSLAQGGTLLVQQSVTCSGTYTVTQADFNTKTEITNNCGATFTGLARIQSNTVVTPLVRISRFSISKTGDLLVSTQAGDVINYTVSLQNQGNSDLTGLVLSDPLLGSNGLVCNPAGTTLAVGSTTTCRGSYTVTQNDLNSGSNIVNVATASFTSLAPQSANFTTRVTGLPSLTISKTASPTVVSASGQVFLLS